MCTQNWDTCNDEEMWTTVFIFFGLLLLFAILLVCAICCAICYYIINHTEVGAKRKVHQPKKLEDEVSLIVID